MTKYLNYFLLAIIMCSYQLNAQHQVGIIGGVNIPNYSYFDSDIHFSAKVKTFIGYNVNGLFILDISPKYSQSFSFGFDQRKYNSETFSGDSFGFKKDSTQTNLTFGNFIFMNRFKPLDTQSLYFGVGFSVGKLFKTSEKGTYTHGTTDPVGNTVYTENYDISSTTNKYYDFSFLVSSSYIFKLNESFSLMGEAAYKISLNSMNTITRNDILAMRFNDFRFSIGILKSIPSRRN